MEDGRWAQRIKSHFLGFKWVRIGFKRVRIGFGLALIGFGLGSLCVKKTDTLAVGDVRMLCIHNDFWLERFLHKLGSL